MIWAFLYVAGLILTWIVVIRIISDAHPAHDTTDELFIVWISFLVALLWPVTGVIALVWHLMFNRSKEKK